MDQIRKNVKFRFALLLIVLDTLFPLLRTQVPMSLMTLSEQSTGKFACDFPLEIKEEDIERFQEKYGDLIESMINRPSVNMEMIGNCDGLIFDTGWIVVDERVEKMVYVSKIELKFLVSELHDVPLDEYYRALGIPQNGLLRLTKQDLFNMPQSEKDNLRHKLQTFYIPLLINDLSDFDIFPFDGSGIKFGWVPNSHIP